MAIFKNKLILEEQSAPSNPAAGKVSVYAKTGGRVYAKDSGGTEHDLTGTLGEPDFEDDDVLITLGATVDIAHSLGVTPKLVMCHLECQVADLGYSVGKKVGPISGQAGVGNTGHTVSWDSTNITVRFGQGVYRLINQSGFSEEIDDVKWRLVVSAWI